MKHFTQSSQIQTEWVHPLCAFFSPAFDLVDPDSMVFDLHSTKDLGRRASKKQSCEICLGSQGTLFPCNHPDCKKNIHAFCGLWEKAVNNIYAQEQAEENPEMVEESNNSEWTVKIFLEPNASVRNHSLKSTPLTKDELETIYREFKATERKIQKSEEPIEHTISKKKEKSKKKLISDDKFEKAQDLSLELHEGFHSFLQAFEEKFRQESTSVQTRKKELESLPNEDSADSSNNARGGKMVFQCPAHKSAESYCLCDPMNQENPSMIACDYCDNWFHFGCVGLGNKSKEAACKEIPYYLCPKCRDWLKFKAKLLKFDRKLATSEGIITLEEISQQELLPKDPNTARFRLPDYILVYRVVLRKILRVARNPPESGLEAFLRSLLDVLCVLPFKIPRKFEELKRGKHLSYCLNYLLDNDARKLLDDMTIESCLSPKGEFQQEKFDKALENKQKIANLEEYFRKKGLDLKPRLLQNKHKNLLILDWIIEYHDTFSIQHEQKPSFETLSSLKAQIKTYGIEKEKYLEVEVLEEKLSDFEATIQRLQSKLLPEKKMEIEANIIEKNYKNFDEYLNELFNWHRELIINRLASKELESLEAEIVSLEFEWGDLRKVLQTENQKLEDWTHEYRNFKVLRGQDLERMLHRTDDLLTQSPEMFELLDLFREYKRFGHELERLLERLQEEKAIVSLEEIKQLLDKADKRLDFEEKAEKLRRKVKDYEELQTKLRSLLSKPMELTIWNRVKKDYGAVMAGLEMEEVKEFEEKLRLYKEITGVLGHKKFTIAKLVEFEQKAEAAKLDEKLLKELNVKVTKANGLKAEIQAILEKHEFDFADSERISNLLLEIKTNRFDFDEINMLKTVLDSFDDIEKLYKLWQQTQGDSSSINESPKEKNFKQLTEKLRDVEKLRMNLSLVYQELKDLVGKYSAVQVLDENLKQVLDLYQDLLLTYDAQQLLAQKSGQINAEMLESLYRDTRNLTHKPEMILQVEDIYKKYVEIKETLEKKISSIEEQFQSIEKSEDSSTILQNRLEGIDKELAESGFLFQDLQRKAKLLKTWLEWLQRALELLKLLAEGKEIDFESSNKLVSLGQKINFPLLNPVFTELHSLFDHAASFKEKISAYTAEKRKSMESLKVAKSDNATRKRFFDLNKTKPHLKEVQDLIAGVKEEVAKNPYLAGLLRQELTEAEADLENTRDFLERYETFRRNHKVESIQDLKEMKSNDFEILKTQIISFRQESLWNVYQYSKDWDMDFSRFEMKFHGFAILAGLQPVSLVFLKNYLKFAEDSKDEDVLKESFMRELSEIHSKARELSTRIEELKGLCEELVEDPAAVDRRDFISEQGLESMVEQIKASVVNFAENKTFIEGLAQKYRKVKEFYQKNQLKNSQTRVIHLEFMRFFEEIRVLPVNFEDYDFLQTQVLKHEVLQRYLEKSKKYLAMEQVPVKIAETLLEKYSLSRILINDFEKLQEKFNKSSQLMEELEKKIALFDDFLPQSLEEYTQLSAKFDNIGIDFGERTLKVRVLLFKQKVHFIEETREKAKGAGTKPPMSKVSFKQLKHDLQYGYSLLLNEEIVEKLRGEIKVLESLLLEIEEKLKEIEEIKLVTILEDYNPIFLNFIDLSEELIEYKMSVAYEKEARITVDLGIKRFYEIYREGCDCLKLMRNLDIVPCNRGLVDTNELGRIFTEEPNLELNREKNMKKFSFLKEPVGGNKEKIGDSSKSKEKIVVKSKEKVLASSGMNQSHKAKEKKHEVKSKEKQNGDKDKTLGKRKVNPTSFGNEFITGFLDDEEKDDGEKPAKKIKKDSLNGPIAQKPSLLKPLGLKDPPIKDFPISKEKDAIKPVAKTVSGEKREDIMNKLDKLTKNNAKWKKTNKNIKSFMQILENQIFGSFHNNPMKYETESQNLLRLFEKLLKFPYISANLLTKNFRVEIVQNLTKSIEKLAQIEGNLKAKEQEREQKTQETALPTTVKKQNQIMPVSKPLGSSNVIAPVTKKLEGPALEKKVKTEQYDPFEKSVPKKVPIIPQAPKEDPLKDLFSSLKEKPKAPNQDKKPSSLLALTENTRTNKTIESLTSVPEKSHQNTSNAGTKPNVSKSKHSILENYEALSSDDEKNKKTVKNEQGSAKKDEKKLEFSDDESTFSYEKMSLGKKRYSLENSEDSFDNLSKSSQVYDPMTDVRKPEIEQAILFDPDNEEGPNNNEKYQLYTQKFAPRGSILKIYDGRFRLNHMISINASFLTIEEIGVVRENFPKIALKDKGSSLKLSGTTDYRQFSDFYFVSLMN